MSVESIYNKYILNSKVFLGFTDEDIEGSEETLDMYGENNEDLYNYEGRPMLVGIEHLMAEGFDFEDWDAPRLDLRDRKGVIIFHDENYEDTYISILQNFLGYMNVCFVEESKIVYSKEYIYITDLPKYVKEMLDSIE